MKRHYKIALVFLFALPIGIGAVLACLHSGPGALHPKGSPQPAPVNETISKLLYFNQAKASPGIVGHNGVATDGKYIYTFGDKPISKYLPSKNWTSPWTLVANSPLAAAKAGAAHLGAGAYNPQNGYLYIAAENYSSPTHYDHQRIAVYRANDLSFVEQKSIAQQGAEISGLALDLQRGLIYVSSFVQSDKVYKYHLSDFSYAGAIQLAKSIPKTQCIAYKNDRLYIGDDATNRITIVDLHGKVLDESPKVAKVNLEGIDYSSSSMLVLDEQNTQRAVWQIPPSQLARAQ